MKINDTSLRFSDYQDSDASLEENSFLKYSNMKSVVLDSDLGERNQACTYV